MSNPSNDSHRAEKTAKAIAVSNVNVGLPLTLILMVAYAGFIGLGTFAPSVLAKPVFTGGTTTWAFAYGLFVIALGVVLAGAYVLIANRRA
jgi:uncharacterized membrane protein (DUF485 family)